MRSNDYGVKATVTIRSFGIPHQWITMVDMLSHLTQVIHLKEGLDRIGEKIWKCYKIEIK